MRKRKLAALSLLGLLGCFIAAAGFSLAFSHIESSPNGVHQRLLVPLAGLGTAKVAMPAGTSDAPTLGNFFDGPVVTRKGEKAWSATWFCNNRVQHLEGEGDTLPIQCAGERLSFHVRDEVTKAPSSSFAAPSRLLILSDVEGNKAYLDRALRHLGVVDAQGRWSFGENHVVIAGDSVDRGRDVFAVLWGLHNLARQARAAGGQLHFLLGNHEQYILRGNTSRAHPDHLYALAQMGGPVAAFGGDTVVGNWLRQQPVVLKIGKVLITHGGIGPMVLKHQLTLDQINDGMRRYWRGEPASVAQLDAALGPSGVTQYRGYFEAMPDQYPAATAADVQAVARAFDVDHIVVGHTIVERVTGLFGNRVFAVDVNSNTAATEALMFVNGQAQVVDTRSPRGLAEAHRGTTRPINLFSADDWTTLSRNAARTWELMQLPHPY